MEERNQLKRKKNRNRVKEECGQGRQKKISEQIKNKNTKISVTANSGT
jgi:hypothetical protein